MTFDDWSLNKKLRLNFALYLISFCLFMGASLTGFSQIKKQFNEVATDSVPDIIAILELKSVSKRLFAEIQGFIATGDIDEVEEFAESVELFDEWMERWGIHDNDTAELGLKRKMGEHKRTFNDYAQTIFSLAAEQQELIEEFEELHDSEFVSASHHSFEADSELTTLHHDLENFYRITYLTMLTASEEEDDEDEGGESAQPQDKDDDDHHDVEHDELLAELSQSIAVKANRLDDADSQLLMTIVKTSHNLIAVNSAIREYLELVEDYEDEILETLDLAVELQNNEVNQAFYKVERSVQSFVIFVSFIGIVGVVLIFLVFRLIGNSVSSRLSELVTSVQQVAKGDLKHTTKVRGHDEFGILSDNFNQMTQKLHETTVSRDYVDNILANMTESLIVTSPIGVIEVVNDETLLATGYQREELVGQHISVLMPSNPQVVEHALNEKHDEHRAECTYVAKTGSSIEVLFSSSHLFNTNGKQLGVICIASDIGQIKQIQRELEQSNTDLKTAQTQLIQASKLASIGELSAGVAHELNQPLMIIRNGGQLVERRRNKGTLDDEKLGKFVDSVLSNSKRMMKIIDHLRTFSRHSPIEFIEVDVNKVVNDSFLMVGEQLKLHGISSELKLAETLPAINGEANQLEQVLLNLIGNARDAMDAAEPEHKQLKLTTRLSSDQQFVEIVVADNGGGMPKEIQSRIFDPFYTTKEEGKGTGLGLSISYGIISDHNGTIDITDSTEAGTTMCIKLPAIPLNNSQDNTQG